MRSAEKERAEFDQLYQMLTSLAQKGKPLSSEELKHVMKGSSMTRKRHPSTQASLREQVLPPVVPQTLPLSLQASQKEVSSQLLQKEPHDIRKKHRRKHVMLGKTVVLEDPLPTLHTVTEPAVTTTTTTPTSSVLTHEEESEHDLTEVKDSLRTPVNHVVQDMLRMAEEHHISKRDLWEALKKELAEEEMACDACHKRFANRDYLAQHIERSSLCKRWLDFAPYEQCRTLNGALHLFVHDCLEQAIMSENFQCPTCLSRFSTKGNLYKHLNSSAAILCNRFACYEFKKIIARI